MHNKFMIIDEKTIENGGFNYTFQAERANAENVLVITNAAACLGWPVLSNDSRS